MRYLIAFFLIIAILSCNNHTRKYLRVKGVNDNCLYFLLEMQNTFYRFDKNKNLYKIKFKSSEKQEQHREFKELVWIYDWDTSRVINNCITQLDKHNIKKILGPPSQEGPFGATYYLILNPECIEIYRDGSLHYDYCNRLSFEYQSDSLRIKSIYLDISELW